MPADSWFEEVEPETPLTQGDLIFECPVIAWKSEALEGASDEDLMGGIEALSIDVIVMTQACDLEQEKAETVILCPHDSLSDYRYRWETEKRRQDQNPTDKAWRSFFESVRSGFIWNLAVLDRHEDGVQLEHRIVDFQEVYTVPRAFLESVARRRTEPRLRLVAPYREHISQAFARFFMRVGLPLSVSSPW